jgi:hypothetical protein
MSRTTLIVWGMGAMLSAVVTAQAPRDTPSSPPMTLTGCVRTWDVSSMGAPPATSAGTSPLVLTGAERVAPPAVPAAPSAAAAAPVPADAPGRSAHSTYLLKPAADAVRLSAYVDRKVEVTGTLVADAAAATPAARSTPSPTAARDGAAPPSPPVAFTVSAIRSLEPACPAP